MSGIDGECTLPCDFPCETCLFGTRNNCTSCPASYPYKYENTCTSLCPWGTYTQLSTCLNCHKTCGFCKDASELSCIRCQITQKETLYLNPDNSCQVTCPQNYTKNTMELICDEIQEIATESIKTLPVYAVYGLITQTFIVLSVIVVSKLKNPDTNATNANILALLSIVEFSEKLALLVYL